MSMHLIFSDKTKTDKKVHKNLAMMVKVYVEHYVRKSACESGPSFHIPFLYVLESTPTDPHANSNVF